MSGSLKDECTDFGDAIGAGATRGSVESEIDPSKNPRHDVGGVS